MLKIIFLLFFSLSFNCYSAIPDSVLCNGKIFSIDYLLQANQKPFGDLYPEKDFNPYGLPQQLIYIALIEKFAPKLRPTLNDYLKHIKNNNDQSAPIFWQESALEFESVEVPIVFMPMLSHCAENGKIKLALAINQMKNNKSIVFEFNKKLFDLYFKDKTQLTFLLMGNFLRMFNEELEDVSLANAFLHSLKSFNLNKEAGDFVFKNFVVQTQAIGVCNRSPELIYAISKATGLTCELVNEEELSKIESLEITKESSQSKIWQFKSGDFQGLKGLNSLLFDGINQEILSIPSTEFAHLKLKKLTLINSDSRELPSNILKTQFELDELILKNNLYFEFRPNQFLEVFSLTKNNAVTLDLSDNNSTILSGKPRVYLHNGSFKNCGKITHLYLRNMNLTKLEPQAFLPLINLKVLDLSKNYIRFADLISTIKNLRIEELIISRNNLTETELDSIRNVLNTNNLNSKLSMH